MTKEKLFLYDTTLRDGQQTQGVQFSTPEKHQIADALDRLGVDYIEGGWPGANPTDSAFFEEAPETKAVFTAFGMTKRAGRSAANDEVLAAVLNAGTPAVCLVGKTHDFHVTCALGITLEENLENIRESVAHIVAQGREALFDAEHFFDGYKANPEYALACAQAAIDAGARWVVLCDTNGGSQPSEVHEIVKAVCERIPGQKVGIHAHNDTDQAVANSLAAVEAGARQIQGTINGIGERCGNANLISLIPTLALKPHYAEKYEIGIDADKLKGLTRLSRTFDELLNRAPYSQAPYAGSSAFATKAGIHASALMKDPTTYEHVAPEAVGNQRNLMVSDQGGKSNFLDQLSRRGIKVSKSDPKLDTLIALVKEREATGYAYEAAEASFELLARRTLGSVSTFFDVESFRVGVERRFNAIGEVVTVSEAVVRLDIQGEQLSSVAEGEGPVNALDRALRKDLGKYQKQIEDLELVDYKVRILNGGTEAITRVLIESTDETGERWWTVGVSDNIIDASFQALIDSLNYKLVKSDGNSA